MKSQSLRRGFNGQDRSCQLKILFRVILPIIKIFTE